MGLLDNLAREERIGLIVAAALHAALVVAFLIQPGTREEITPAQRMTVNLASEVGLEAAAPVPVAESRAAIAPTLSDEPAPAPEPLQPIARPEPQPVPQPRAEPPAAVTRPAPADARPRRRPDTPAARTPAPAPAQARPAPAPARPATPSRQAGGSRVGDNFLAGMGDSTRTTETRAAASAIGASERASIAQAVARQLKPHWQPPSGPDVNEIVTRVRFRLNPDGSLSGRPEVLSQSGINEVNRTQAGRHGELAVRAVQLAAPFDLPEQYYSGWRVITANLDWRLSQ